jgi:hypothetical protein
LDGIGCKRPDSQWPVEVDRARYAGIEQYCIKPRYSASKETLREGFHREEGGEFDILGSEKYAWTGDREMWSDNPMAG